MEEIAWRKFDETNVPCGTGGLCNDVNCPNWSSIRETIPSIPLVNGKCGVRGCIAKYFPGGITRTTRPLQRVNFDLVVLFVARILCGCLHWFLMDLWIQMAKRWMAEISDLRAIYPLLLVMRDNETTLEKRSQRDCLIISYQCRTRIIIALGKNCITGKTDLRNLESNQCLCWPEAKWRSPAWVESSGSVQRLRKRLQKRHLQQVTRKDQEHSMGALARRKEKWIELQTVRMQSMDASK